MTPARDPPMPATAPENLATPSGEAPAPPPPGPPSAARRPLRVVIQVVGFLAGVGLLGWCVSVAFKPENREQLERLREASPVQLLGLLGLSIATLIINGFIFWVTIRPARRLKAPDVLATNAVSTFLGYLPFKLGLVVRVAIHNRRDKVPLLTVGAWFAAVAVTLFATLIPAAIAGLWRKKLDGPWLIATLAGLALAYAAVVIGARLFAGERGLARLQSSLGRLPLAGKLLRTNAFRQLHGGFDMLANAKFTAAAMGLRLADLVVMSSRFSLASVVLGSPIPWEQSFLVASTYFFIGLLSPFGVLGTREAGTTGVVALLLPGGEEAARAFTVVALLVSATEAIAFLAAAGVGLAWLRPDRLLRARSRDGL